jgi:TonB family protein
VKFVTGGGVGTGNGDGCGPGSGGMGGGVYRVGGEVSAPVLISKTEPEYSEEARKAKYSGTVLLSLVVGADGLPRDIKVIRPLGLGLDEKAVEAVQKWRFRAGVKGGHSVATQATIEVSFRLL